jgi:hypothetical protein
MAKTKVIVIRPVESYNIAADDEILSRSTAVLNGMTGNTHFTTPPVDLNAFKTNIDTFATLIAEARDGSKKVIAAKNKQRHVLIDNLKLFARYVEVMSNGDMAAFKTSGLQPKAPAVKTAPQPLPVPGVPTVGHGAVSGQLLVQIKKIPKAKSYNLRRAPLVNGLPGAWVTELVSTVKTPFPVNGLTPGTTYAFQVQALGKLGYTDFSDSATFMAT